MRLKEYSLSKAPYLIINLLIYLLVFILFRIADVSYKELAVIFLIWFLPMITYFLIEFFVKRRFYMEVYDVMRKLDKKYILAEVIKEPNSYEEKIVYDILKECNREMHEHVNFYKRLQRDYREIISKQINCQHFLINLFIEIYLYYLLSLIHLSELLCILYNPFLSQPNPLVF